MKNETTDDIMPMYYTEIPQDYPLSTDFLPIQEDFSKDFHLFQQPLKNHAAGDGTNSGYISSQKLSHRSEDVDITQLQLL